MSSVTLHQGDCLDIMKIIPDHSIDAIICDLPFGTTQCEWDIPLDLNKLWDEYFRITKEDAPIVLFCAQPFTSRLIMSKIENYRYLWYWEKEKGTNFFRTSFQPLRVIEEICVFSKTAKNVYNAQMLPLDKPYKHTMPLKHSAITGKGIISDSQTAIKREYKEYTHSSPKNILKFSRDKAQIPTQKPVALLEYMIKTYTNPGDIVLDNTMGSGTCGVACKKLERDFIGIELNEKHFNIAKKRIENEDNLDFFKIKKSSA